jgi:hypothetical protein
MTINLSDSIFANLNKFQVDNPLRQKLSQVRKYQTRNQSGGSFADAVYSGNGTPKSGRWLTLKDI